MWVRGLKLRSDFTKHALWVAPYVGAWIETTNNQDLKTAYGRTLCGCVD